MDQKYATKNAPRMLNNLHKTTYITLTYLVVWFVHILPAISYIVFHFEQANFIFCYARYTLKSCLYFSSSTHISLSLLGKLIIDFEHYFSFQTSMIFFFHPRPPFVVFSYESQKEGWENCLSNLQHAKKNCFIFRNKCIFGLNQHTSQL